MKDLNKTYSEYLAEELEKDIKYSEYLTSAYLSETEQEKIERERREKRELRKEKIKRIFNENYRNDEN